MLVKFALLAIEMTEVEFMLW